jgi:hypothetical protein
MSFKNWLISMGCWIEVTQANDGSGYECWAITLPDGTVQEVTINV